MDAATCQPKTLVTFPEPQQLNVNMMPIIMGEMNTVPQELWGYQPLIDACHFEKGATVYLTVTEGWVDRGQTLRRTGPHTEAFDGRPWGGEGQGWGGAGRMATGWGGGWGGTGAGEGLFFASTDGRCRIYPELRSDGDRHGALVPRVKGFNCEPRRMYWITDITPHEALPALTNGPRQWFRLVGPKVDVWWAQHNTPNPLGVTPKACVLNGSKFE